MRYWFAVFTALLVTAAGARGETRPRDLGRFFTGHEGAFVMLDVRNNRTIRFNAPRCKQRFVPCSTFKIPNSLVGLETGVIPNPEHRMRWDGKKQYIPSHNRDHTMRSAFKESVGWYYQRLAAGVGTERMRRYVKGFRYGNQEVSDASTRFWHGSLKISAEEQVAFLLRLHRNGLPVSRRTLDEVRKLMFAVKTDKGVLRGKTGTDGYPKGDEMIATLGWYVGWVEHNGSAYIFATNISGGENPTGRDARRITENILRSEGLL